MEQLHHVRVVLDIPWIKSMRIMVLKNLRVVPRSSIIQLAGSQVISALEMTRKVWADLSFSDPLLIDTRTRTILSCE